MKVPSRKPTAGKLIRNIILYSVCFIFCVFNFKTLGLMSIIFALLVSFNIFTLVKMPDKTEQEEIYKIDESEKDIKKAYSDLFGRKRKAQRKKEYFEFLDSLEDDFDYEAYEEEYENDDDEDE